MAFARRAAIDALTTDFRYILDAREVPQELQADLSDAGFRSTALFAVIADDRAGVRAARRTDYGLDPGAEGLDAPARVGRRTNAARLLDAWETCTRRIAEQRKVEAEQRADRMPLTMVRGDHIALRLRYEQDHGPLQDRFYPADGVVERRLEEVDEGECRAEALSEVVSKEEESETPFAAAVNRDGTIKVRKAVKTVSLPGTSERLRLRIRILGITYQLARYKHASRPWLATATKDLWYQHSDFLLGDEVAGMQIQSGDKTSSYTPPFAIVLEFEHQLRKAMCRKIMYEGRDIQTALQECWRDPHLKERYFVTPTALSICIPSQMSPRAPPAATPSGQKRANSASAHPGGSKGRKKGKGKGKGINLPANYHRNTPDGRRLCFKYNTANISCSGSCNYVHACQVCFGPHPAYKCNSAHAAALPQPTA